MKSKLVAMFASLALAFAAPAHAQKGDKPLFAASDPIHIVVQAPLSSITRNTSLLAPPMQRSRKAPSLTDRSPAFDFVRTLAAASITEKVTRLQPFLTRNDL